MGDFVILYQCNITCVSGLLPGRNNCGVDQWVVLLLIAVVTCCLHLAVVLS